uniref:Tyrosine recombinase XerC n=1 Tax=Candidatus Methanogaster sp. ANME-2c ERB4 TaxID=2759911 RepID=A0A7G9YA19_9EURY|nr:tyrosine recombinase XerC [Methanosarcinales archaeon ANME-2c ERB4]QNO44853.1 tyrosine recombinase XerC [Methanosarcinales archaeon ANME-2c ERB4]QNO46595.1 tyrosine recombinase XerC [Methanosarcinales archaeon ANME-2c ERB4]
MTNAVQDYFRELETVNRISFEYQRRIHSSLREFAILCGGETEYDVATDATESDVMQYINVLRGRDLCDDTVRSYISFIRGFYSFLIERPDYDCTYNPCTRLYRKLPAGKKQTRRPFKTTMEVAALIKSIMHPRDRCVATLFAKTGIRRGELCGLDLDDVDLDNDVLHIYKHLVDSNGVIQPGRKNGRDVETDIPIDPELHKVLEVYIALRPRTSNPALFLTYDGNRLGGRGVGEALQKWITRHWGNNGNRTAEKITAHWFRAFLTYELSVNGCNPAVITAIRGDRAAKIQDFYTMQVLGFDKIREEYLKAAPVFGL